MTVTRPVSYEDGATQLGCVLAWPESSDEGLPGLMFVHRGPGLDDHALAQAG